MTTTTAITDFARNASPALEAMLPKLDAAAQQALAQGTRVLLAVELNPMTLDTSVVLAVIDGEGKYRRIAHVPAVMHGAMN